MEAYTGKYFKKYGDIKGYAFIAKSLEGDTVFEVDMARFIDELFEQEGQSHRVFFHNGAGYDFKFLLAYLQDMCDNRGKSHTFKFFAMESSIFQMRYTIRKREYVRDKDGQLIRDGYTKGGSIKYKKREYRKVFLFSDSYKLWPMGIAQMGAAVGMPKLDYGDYDIIDEFKTKEQYMEHNGGKSFEYFNRDVDIPIKFYNLTKEHYDIATAGMTIAGTAYKEMCSMTPSLKFSRLWIGDMKIWKQIHSGFNGGFTWVNPIHQLKEIKDVYKYDVNSLYPFIMRNFPMPVGTPKLKKTKIADRLRYYSVSYSKATALSIPFMSRGRAYKEFDMVQRGLTGEEFEEFADLEAEYPSVLPEDTRMMNNYMLSFFKKHYKIEGLKVKFMYEFEQKHGMFDKYIDKWNALKMSANDKPAERWIFKLFLNANYGRFAMKLDMQKGEIKKRDKLIEEGKVIEVKNVQKLMDGKLIKELENDYIYFREQTKIRQINKQDAEYPEYDMSYIPIADVITTLARIQLLKDVMHIPEAVVYTDTDSIHSKIPLEDILNIHDTEMGAWKYEGTVGTGIYRRPKHYMNLNIKEGNKITKYLLKGGGFNVKLYNEKQTITPEMYLQEEFTIANGKLHRLEVFGKPIIVAKDYKFTMPKTYKKGTH